MSRQITALMLVPALALAAPLAPLAAQDAGDPYAVCAAMTDANARLGCFDTTYAAQGEARAEQARLAAEAAALEDQRRAEEFGFVGEDLRDRRAAAAQANPDDADRIARIEEEEREERDYSVSAVIAEVLTDGSDRAVVILDNGTLWRERSGSQMRGRVRAGWDAVITRHWSGAYEMRFEGRPGVLRVERIR